MAKAAPASPAAPTTTTTTTTTVAAAAPAAAPTTTRTRTQAPAAVAVAPAAVPASPAPGATTVPAVAPAATPAPSQKKVMPLWGRWLAGIGSGLIVLALIAFLAVRAWNKIPDNEMRASNPLKAEEALVVALHGEAFRAGIEGQLPNAPITIPKGVQSEEFSRKQILDKEVRVLQAEGIMAYATGPDGQIKKIALPAVGPFEIGNALSLRFYSDTGNFKILKSDKKKDIEKK